LFFHKSIPFVNDTYSISKEQIENQKTISICAFYQNAPLLSEFYF